jgi:hypothetical protein
VRSTRIEQGPWDNAYYHEVFTWFFISSLFVEVVYRCLICFDQIWSVFDHRRIVQLKITLFTRFMIESMTDSGKYKDNSVATVCQVRAVE